MRVAIDAERLLGSLDMLAQIGAIDGGGCCRLAFSDEDATGRRWLASRMRMLEMDVRIDAIGNVVGRYEGRDPSLAPVMMGSHVDTVRTGGRYDGNLGVLAGLEVVAALRDVGLRPLRAIEVGAFANEEGARFAPDMMGSLVYVGDLALDDAMQARDADGVRVADAGAASGCFGDAAVPGPRPHAFLELHIEQGPVLDREDFDLGVVEAVQGICWQRYTFHGTSNHAGTTPMAMRHDAGYVAMRVGALVRELPARYPGEMVATVGVLRLEPELVNVVPRRAEMTIDLRNVDRDALVAARDDLDAEIRRIDEAEGVRVERAPMAFFDPFRFDAAVVERVARHCAGTGRRVRRMVSGAGHDAQILGRVAPAGMIFVPSVAGLSHNVREHTEAEHLALGAQVLADVAVELAEEAA